MCGCSLYQLSQLVDEPTRVTETSSTSLVDLILTNRPENILSTGVIHLAISDHSLIYAVRKFKLPRSSPIIKEVRDFKHFSIDPIPWITFAINQTMRNRDLRKREPLARNLAIIGRYQNLRNKANREMKLSNSQFYHSLS